MTSGINKLAAQLYHVAHLEVSLVGSVVHTVGHAAQEAPGHGSPLHRGWWARAGENVSIFYPRWVWRSLDADATFEDAKDCLSSSPPSWAS